MIPTTRKIIHKVRVTYPGWFNMELPHKAFFPLSNRCYDHCKNIFLPIFIAVVVRETYSFIKTIQPISPNYNWENGVKQIKITEENLSQSCMLCQLLRPKTLPPGSKCIKHFLFYFYHYFPYICCVNVNYLTRLVFLKSSWWLVWIFCASTSLRKQNIKNISGPSKILKNISWPINIRLNYFMNPTATLQSPLLHTWCTVPKI